MNYEELVKALRYCEFGFSARTCDNCEYSKTDCQLLLSDAADAIEELMNNLDMASQELSWTISYAMHLMRDIDELHDMVNEVYYDEL